MLPLHTNEQGDDHIYKAASRLNVFFYLAMKISSVVDCRLKSNISVKTFISFFHKEN